MGRDTKLGRTTTATRNQMDFDKRFKQAVVLSLEDADFFYPVSHHSECTGCFSGHCWCSWLSLLACDLSICQTPA